MITFRSSIAPPVPANDIMDSSHSLAVATASGTAEPAECFLGGKLGQDMVTIYVGPKRKKFNVHKELICESDFFKAAFMSCFAEANDGVMYLPDDDPAAFDLYVEWAYRKRIPAGSSESFLFTLYELYIMADKFCNIILKDIVMDTIQDLAKTHGLLDPMFSKKLVLKVFECSSDDTRGLAIFLVHLMCFAFLSRMVNKGCDGKIQASKTLRGEDLDTMWEIGKENKTIFRLLQDKIITDVRGPPNKMIVDPRNRDESRTPSRCRYHTHCEGFYCREKDESTDACFVLDISRKGCTPVSKPASKLSLSAGETAYPITRVASRTQKWKNKQCNSSWTLVLSSHDRLLRVYNDLSDHVLDISIDGIDRIVTCELGNSPQIIIHRSRYNDPARPAVGVEFKTTDQCNVFRDELRDTCKTRFNSMSILYVEKSFQGIVEGPLTEPIVDYLPATQRIEHAQQ